MTYTLILTIILAGNYHGSGGQGQAAAVHSVDGFRSEKECLAAGDAWIKQQLTVDTTQARRRFTALCVGVQK